MSSDWGFALYRASHNDYEDSFLPNGRMGGSPEEALDCPRGLYLADPTMWRLESPAKLRRRPPRLQRRDRGRRGA